MDPNTTVGGDTVSTQSSPVDGMNDQLENNGTNGIPPPPPLPGTLPPGLPPSGILPPVIPPPGIAPISLGINIPATSIQGFTPVSNTATPSDYGLRGLNPAVSGVQGGPNILQGWAQFQGMPQGPQQYQLGPQTLPQWPNTPPNMLQGYQNPFGQYPQYPQQFPPNIGQYPQQAPANTGPLVPPASSQVLVPPPSQQAPQGQQGSNNPQMNMIRNNNIQTALPAPVALFIGYTKGRPDTAKPSLHVKIWIKQFENYLIRDGFYLDDERKISMLKSFIDPENGDAFEVVNAQETLSKATDYNVFKEHLINIFSSDQESKILVNFENILKCEWERDTSIFKYATILSVEIEKYRFAYSSVFGVLPSEETIRIIAFHKIRQNCQPKYQKILDEKVDLKENFLDMVIKLSAKEIAFKNGTCLKHPRDNQGKNFQTKNVRTVSSADNNSPKAQASFKKQSQQNRTFQKSYQQYPASNRPNKQIPPLSEGFNPKHRCINCEHIGHMDVKCPMPPWCGHCRERHARGSTDRCKNSRWDWSRSPAISKSLPDLKMMVERAKARALEKREAKPNSSRGNSSRTGGRPTANSRQIGSDYPADENSFGVQQYTEEELARYYDQSPDF
jgi:hypothetical protein